MDFAIVCTKPISLRCTQAKYVTSNLGPQQALFVRVPKL
jgi:hypothetical protein